ncbi:lycopene beta-cyclase CrtY [Sphingomonas hengshuiensis]|uniref:Lycopene cyclase n=1 Tax=Sphingomonas hengshuiensis TaxID=1609977 RepID=A0A7U4JBA6_9SPHN|nr:lycopene beta-cyclase CrtY [Sphingomonas hengshuiensis]AJP73660.1 lycopene cyclase [Sphingomonas hengshuiensis]
MSATIHCDIAIVGGGLAGGLIALALRRKRPACNVLLIEGSQRVGGNHLWSFFASDVAAEHRWLVAPLVCHGWTRYAVAFPGQHRTLKTSYYSIESSRLDQLVRAALPPEALLLGRQVEAVTSTHVTLADGDQVIAKGVIDCRGTGALDGFALGWQKFHGRELELEIDHGLDAPLVMDATVEQIDGFRFVYCLPFTPSRMFVEDTYYSDGPALDTKALGARIDAYVAARGWKVRRVLREESGVLPVVIGGDFDAYWQAGGPGVAKAGMRAGLFHSLTSYSLPDAVRTAVLIAESGVTDGDALHAMLYRHARTGWRKRRFYRMLTAMFFKAAEPEKRYRVIARFYRLNEGLVRRFYAGQSTLRDRARILTGKPPVPVGRAIKAIWGQATLGKTQR